MSAQPLKIDLLSLSGELLVSTKNNSPFIWDPCRKKNVRLKPEEMVRQLLIQYLNTSCHVGFGRMIAEKQIPKAEGRRFDVGIMGSAGRYLLLAECKSFKVDLNTAVLDQITTYNASLEADYLLITNGKQTYAWRSSPDLEFISEETSFQALF